MNQSPQKSLLSAHGRAQLEASNVDLIAIQAILEEFNKHWYARVWVWAITFSSLLSWFRFPFAYLLSRRSVPSWVVARGNDDGVNGARGNENGGNEDGVNENGVNENGVNENGVNENGGNEDGGNEDERNQDDDNEDTPEVQEDEPQEGTDERMFQWQFDANNGCVIWKDRSMNGYGVEEDRQNSKEEDAYWYGYNPEGPDPERSWRETGVACCDSNTHSIKRQVAWESSRALRTVLTRMQLSLLRINENSLHDRKALEGLHSGPSKSDHSGLHACVNPNGGDVDLNSDAIRLMEIKDGIISRHVAITEYLLTLHVQNAAYKNGDPTTCQWTYFSNLFTLPTVEEGYLKLCRSTRNYCGHYVGVPNKDHNEIHLYKELKQIYEKGVSILSILVPQLEKAAADDSKWKVPGKTFKGLDGETKTHPDFVRVELPTEFAEGDATWIFDIDHLRASAWSVGIPGLYEYHEDGTPANTMMAGQLISQRYIPPSAVESASMSLSSGGDDKDSDETGGDEDSGAGDGAFVNNEPIVRWVDNPDATMTEEELEKLKEDRLRDEKEAGMGGVQW